MVYNFDEIIDRKKTGSLKFDFAKERGYPEDVFPMWIADMDFAAPVEVTQALVEAARHSVYGYTDTKEDYFNAVANWFEKGFGYTIKPEWLVKSPGVVYAVSTAIKATTEPGDAVMIQRPVYYPFTSCINSNERKLINNPLIYKDGKYHIDFEDFEKKIIDNKVKLFILCSPHNPVGRVWTRDELLEIGDICLKHKCIVLSDEIHCDFVYEGGKHLVFSTVSDAFADNCIICTAPSKTFNLAGLQISNVFIANKELRSKFEAEIEKTGYSQLNLMGLVACKSAYESGADWLAQLKAYLAQNITFLNEFLAERLPKVKVVIPEGTYLVWLDFTAYGFSQAKLDDLIVNKARLWLDTGTMFGPEGEGFQRINISCPKESLKNALLRLECAFAAE